jgi:nitrogenase molybdenum-cofactor synthesis protein NifE
VGRIYRNSAPGATIEGQEGRGLRRRRLQGFSLVRALRTWACVPRWCTQTGDADDYATLREMCDPGTIIVDDSNPIELAKFCLEQDVDLFIGGVKERPIAYKLGIGFCDHNHERKECLAGFVGMVNFGREVHASVCSPVWNFVPRRSQGRSLLAGGPAVANKLAPTSGNTEAVA